MRYEPPPLPGHSIQRDRLLALLDLSIHQQVTIVVAPPGYGKTVLLSQWAAARRMRRIRWLTVGPEHQDSGRFAQDLYRVMTSVPSRPDLVHARARRVRETSEGLVASLPVILAELESVAGTSLVLDDFHLLFNSGVLEEFGAFLERSTRSLHVVLVTQVDPPFRYYRPLLAEAGFELRQEDLRFQRDEALALVGRIVDGAVPDAHLDALLEQTEGWPLGLHLAALSLRDGDDSDEFMASLVEDDRHIADYLTEQVLFRLADETREFLLETSVLDVMSGALCDAVTGRVDSEHMLEELDRSSMFITRVENRRGWYRYHPLFRTMLRRHLLGDDPDRERALRRRAATWYLEQGEIEDAAGYLVSGEAWEDLIDTTLEHATTMFLRGKVGQVTRWLAALPRPLTEERAGVSLLEAASRLFSDDMGSVADQLDEFEGQPLTAEERVTLDLVRAWWQLRRGSSASAVATAGAVLERVDHVDRWRLPNMLGMTGSKADVTALARLARAIGDLHGGDLAAAQRLEAHVDETPPAWRVYALGVLAEIAARSGCLVRAEQLAARSIALPSELGIENHWLTVAAHLALADVARHRDEPEQARIFLDRAAARSTRTWPPGGTLTIATGRALCALALGHATDDLVALKGRGIADSPGNPPIVESAHRAAEARVLISIGDLGGAERRLGRAPLETIDVAAVAVQLAVERSALGDARRLLDQWPQFPEPRGPAERDLWLSVIDHLEGDELQARQRLAEVVRHAESESDYGLLRTAGPFLTGLARALYRAAPSPFLRALVSSTAPPQRRNTANIPGLVEHITEREYELLALLPTRMSNMELATHLGVSLNTVKTHLKHIYRKLGVSGRSEAITVAERGRML